MSEQLESFTEEAPSQIAEPEQAEATEQDEPTEAEDTAAEDTADESEASQQSEQPDAKHNFDKGLQKVQQALSQLQRQQAELQRFREQFESQNKEPDPLDKAASDELADETQRAMAAALSDVKKQLASLSGQFQSTQAQSRAEAERQQFARANPELADQFDTLIERARQRVQDEMPADAEPAEIRGFARAVWSQEVQQAKQGASKSAEQAKPSTKPDKSTKGANVTKKTNPKPAETQTEEGLMDIVRGGFTA